MKGYRQLTNTLALQKPQPRCILYRPSCFNIKAHTNTVVQHQSAITFFPHSFTPHKNK